MSDCINRGLHIPSGTPSGIDSWVDYSKRMKPEDAKDADWDHFYKKYYAFIVYRCRNHKNEGGWHLNDDQTQDIVGLVFEKMYKGGRFLYHKSKGPFRSWFKLLIDDVIRDYLRKYYAEKRGYKKDKDDKKDKGDKGKGFIVVSIDEASKLPAEKSTEGDGLPSSLALDEEAFLAMLAWEEVCEKSKPWQLQAFAWHLEGDKPAEIAKGLSKDSKEVSEQIRQFKDKLKTAYKKLGEELDAGNLDWAVIIQRAEEARKKYDMIAKDFNYSAGR